MRAAPLISMMSVVALHSGCGREAGTRSCNDVCERSNECSVAQRPVDVECKLFCPDVVALDHRMEAAGYSSCQEQFDQHLACWENHLSQICNKDFTECTASGKAWTACMTPYCRQNAETHTADPNCNGNGTPALAPF